MYAVLPSIQVQPGVAEAYEREPTAPVGAYRSDAVQPMTQDEVRRMVAETFDKEREPA
jgi:hypothetical protein